LAEIQETIHGGILMRTSQLVDKNLELSEALLQRLLKNPSTVEQITDGINLIILPLDDPELFRANLEQLITLKEQGTTNLRVVVIESADALEPRIVVKV